MLFFYRVYIFLFFISSFSLGANENRVIFEPTFDITKNYLSDAVDQYIQFLGERKDVEEIKKSLKSLECASTSYYGGLDRLFFFKLSYSRNSNKIEYYYRQYLDMRQSSDLEITFHIQLLRAYSSWKLLHHNYSYYVGYVF